MKSTVAADCTELRWSAEDTLNVEETSGEKWKRKRRRVFINVELGTSTLCSSREYWRGNGRD